MNSIYLDNAATTPMYQEVIDILCHASNQLFGNASSTYSLGRLAKKQLEEARRIVAKSINAKPSEIIFTSGGTESNNMALYSLAKATDKKHIITTNIEHPSVLNVFKDLEQQGYQVTYLEVEVDGVLSVEKLKQHLTEDTAFVSIMSVNNEIGSIQNITAISTLLKASNIYFHTDAVQSYGVLPFDMLMQPIDMMSVSAHKIHGPKGIGFLYVRENTPFYSLLKGGGQEDDRRSGTQNIPSLMAFAKAIELLNIEHKVNYLSQLQQLLFDQLNKHNISYQLNGSLLPYKKIPKIVNLWLPNTLASKLLIQMDLSGIMISAGSACSAGSLKPSRVLLEVYHDEKRAQESIRISFSEMTTEQDIITFVEKLSQFVL